MPSNEPAVSIRSHDVGAELRARGVAPGTVATASLRRYYKMLRDALATLNLSEAEATLVLDATDGYRFDENTYDLIGARVVRDARKRGLDKTWKVDLRSLGERLDDLGSCQLMALVDAIERFNFRWADEGTKPTAEQWRRLVREVGLVRDHRPVPV